MIEDRNIYTVTENVTDKDNTTQNPHSGGSFFERRFILYDKMKISLKTIDSIIIICAVLIFVFFILGAYIK